MLKTVVPLILLALAWPAAASQPGQPLDCTDWVILKPGITCSDAIAYPCPLETCKRGLTRVVDAGGGIFLMRTIGHPSQPFCGVAEMRRTQLVRFDGVAEEVVAYIDSRCVSPTGPHITDQISIPELLMDFTEGTIFLPSFNTCSLAGSGSCLYETGYRLTALTGFPPLFQILQTYTPQPAQLAFRVPAHPEGLRAADHFDTYWGHVSDLPDFTKATPIACNYPATPPAVGTRLTVADTSPTPAPGQANYVVTAVSYGAERRYGRQKLGPTMTGRDPALLPACP